MKDAEDKMKIMTEEGVTEDVMEEEDMTAMSLILILILILTKILVKSDVNADVIVN